MYEKYKTIVYKYVVKNFPEADQEEYYQIMKRIWKKASSQQNVLRGKSEREKAAWLLTLAEREICRARMTHGCGFCGLGNFEKDPESNL